MTAKKRKACTLLERHGFKDPDSGSPVHDGICLWLDKNMVAVCAELFAEDVDTLVVNDKVWEKPIIKFTGPEYSRSSTIAATVYLQKGITELIFEVKSAIPSLGDILRELQFYKEHTKQSGCKLIVICHDDTHAPIARQQGFMFYKCPDHSHLAKRPELGEITKFFVKPPSSN
jgi:hypothetical protein